MKKFKICFVEDGRDVSEYESLYVGDAIEQFLDDTYDKNGGWEWMPKRSGRGIDAVQVTYEDGSIEIFEWELEFNPTFVIYKKSEENGQS